MDDFSRYQDIFGQLSFLKSYSHLLLCFPHTEGIDRRSIVNTIEAATVKLTSTFPWIAGKVINEGKGAGNSGLFRVAPCPAWAPPNTLVCVKDCSDLCPSYTEIIRR